MAKVILSDLSNLQNEQTAIAAINANNTAIENAMENTLSRDGTNPNMMLTDIDINSNTVMNLRDAVEGSEAVPLRQLEDYIDSLENGAVIDAQFVVLEAHPQITDERVLTAGTNISLLDAGAGSTLTVSISGDDLNAYEAITTTGLVSRAGSGSVNTRTITAPAAGISVTDGDGVSGDPTLALTNDLAALEGLSTNGMVARTATDTMTTRTVTGTANEITVTNGSGVSGDPTISIPAAVTFTGKTITGGTFTAPTINSPTGITKADVGLGNVDNTSDATKDAAVATLTNKTINLTSNTLTGTTAQFNTALSDNDFATQAGSETLTNKTISGASNTISNVALSSLATQAAYTFVGNNTGSSASPTAVDIAALTTKGSPAGTDYVMISDQAASGAWKKATISSVAAGSSVASFNTATGSLVSGEDIILNASLSVSAAASALTIALKDSAGNDPSAGSPVVLNFRSSTGTTSTPTTISVTAATSLVISSGSTLGVTSSTAFRLWVVGFNDAGTFRLGVINCLSQAAPITTYALNEGALVSSTAEGGAGAADSAGVFYTGTAVSSKPFRILGYLEWSSSGLTAGTWTTTNLSIVQMSGAKTFKPGTLVKTKHVTSTGTASTTGTTYVDGGFSGGTITPDSAANIIKVSLAGDFRQSTAGVRGFSRMARNSNSNMFGAEQAVFTSAGVPLIVPSSYVGIDAPNTTSSTSYLIMIKDGSGGTTIWNSEGINCAMIIEEYFY